MKTSKLFVAVLLVFNFAFTTHQTDPIAFETLSETSRPVAIQFINGTGTQTGLVVGFFNHDTLEHIVAVKRGTVLQPQNERTQSMLIARNTLPFRGKLGFTSCRAE